MRISFIADTVIYDEIDQVLIATVAVGDGGHQYLMFQRSSQDTSDDWGVYLEADDQSHSGYGVISVCHLTQDKLELNLLKPLGNLQEVTGFDIQLNIDEATYHRFVEGMRRIFRGEAENLLTYL